jgi:Fe2+ transport system protein FeoA
MADTVSCECIVPLIETAEVMSIADFLRSEPVQRLMAGRTDFAEVTRAKSYIGQACLWRDRRLVRLSGLLPLEESEFTFVLCHELAHHVAGLLDKHSDQWRRECLALVREAGDLRLLPGRRVAQAVDMLRYGPVGMFRGWPERVRQIKRAKKARRIAVRAELVDMGVEPGAMVRYRLRDTVYRAQVIRVNRCTVSVGKQESDEVLRRVPFERVVGLSGR